MCKSTAQLCCTFAANKKKQTMINTQLDSEFDFGKYNGQTISQVFESNPGYIDWCLENVDFFELCEETIESLKKLNPGFRFSKKALDANNSKLNYTPNPPDPPDPWEHYGRSYDEYGGGPTGDLSDDFIDDVLDGEPDAYWNID